MLLSRPDRRRGASRLPRELRRLGPTLMQRQRLDALIEQLITIADCLDGDADYEDEEDACPAEDAPRGLRGGLNVRIGDDDDAEPGCDAEASEPADITHANRKSRRRQIERLRERERTSV